MAKFVYLYTGGRVAETPEAQEKAMQAWGAWFGSLGDTVVDGGAPFGRSLSVAGSGNSEGSPVKATGYSVVRADSIEEAAASSKGCPILSEGGTVEVFEAIEM